jgi:hypothetical protein
MDRLYEWSDTLERSKNKTASLRRWVIATIAFPYVLSALTLNLAALFVGIFDAGLYLALFRKGLRAGDYGKTVALPDSPLFDRLRSDLNEVGERLDVRSEAIEPRLHSTDISLSPAIRPKKSAFLRRSRETYLHIPVGFIGFYSKHREEGRAILAHEVAHVKQEDWKLWAMLSAYFTILKWVIIPGVVISLIVAAAGLIDARVLVDRIESASAGQANSYGLNYKGPLGELDPPDPGLGPFQYAGVDPLETARDNVFANYFFAVVICLFAGIRLLLGRMIASRRAASEFLADFASGAVTSPQALSSAILLTGPGPASYNFLSAHIPSSRRTQALERDFGLDREEAPAPPGRTAASARSRFLGLVFGGAFHRFFGWAPERTDWGRMLGVSVGVIFIGPLSGLVPLVEDPSSFEYWSSGYLVHGAVIRIVLLAGLTVGLWLSRRDFVSVLIGFCLYAAAYQFLLAPASIRDPSLWAIVRMVLIYCVFFVPLIVALNSGLSIGRAAMIATVVDAAFALIEALLSPSSWDSDRAPSFAHTVNETVTYDLIIVLMLVFGNALGRTLSKLRLTSRHFGPARL